MAFVSLKECWAKGSVGIVFVLFVILRAMDRVYLKRVNNALRNPTYNLVLMNLFWPIGVQVLTAIYMAIYVVIMRLQGNPKYSWGFFLPGNPAACTIGKVALVQLGLFSLGDQINAAISAPASAFISQTMQSVMTNTTILWVVFLATLFLKTRFNQVHYIGCSLITMSVLVGLSTKMSTNDCSMHGMENDECLLSYQGNDGKPHLLTGGTMLLWYGMFLFSIFPAAAASVYKQKVLQDADCDIVYATWWAGNFQVLWGFLCVPLLWVRLPGQNLAPSQTVAAISDTVLCLAGSAPHPADESCAVSPTPMFWFGIYLCFNLSFNILMLWLTKYMSATWTQIATVLCLDLTNVFSTMPFVAGGGAQPMSLNDWLATALASVALWTYNLKAEERSPGAGKTDLAKDMDMQSSDSSPTANSAKRVEV